MLKLVDDIAICSKSREIMEELLDWWRFSREKRGMKI